MTEHPEGLRERLRRGPVYSVWSSSRDPLVAGAAAASGVDYVVIDLQHGGAVEADLPALTAAVVAAGAVPVARVRAATFGDIGRPLDLGAHGVIVPSITSVEHARAAVSACRYPPHGDRSAGRLVGGADDPFVVLMIETAGALEAVEDIAALPGLDGLYIGPNDLSRALGCVNDHADPTMSAAMDRVAAACDAGGVAMGMHALDEPGAAALRDRGYRLLTVVSDLRALRDALAGSVHRLRA